jgi:succinate dehydrogenase/fumarate reductase-like Fe-S protein
MINLTIRAFFFNAQTDYLPYYKNFSLNVKSNQTLLEILEMIKVQNPNFSFPTQNTILRVNELVTTADENIATVVEKVGTEIQIDPALAYRSNNGLTLNNSDFMQSFEILAPFSNDEDKDFYKSLYPLHYASSSFEYNREYIGDAILVLASRLIENVEEEDKKIAILEAINDEFKGIAYCEYENNLLNGEDYSEIINTLKSKVKITTKLSIMDRICNLVAKKRNNQLDTASLHEHKIALYVNNRNKKELLKSTKESVEAIGATFINFPSATRLAGQTLVKSNPELASLKAGKMLLDALDHGADTLLFSEESDLVTFRAIIDSAERAMGRDIELKLVALSSLPHKTKAVA